MPDQLPPTGAVFLSYASEDAEAAACICDALRAAGVEVWFDRVELRVGDAWDSKIKRQIHECALFMPLISRHTDARTEGYFRREWKQATRRLEDIADDATFLIPVVIDDTKEAHARVPEEFRGVHWMRMRGGEVPSVFGERVLQLLRGDPASVPGEESTISKTQLGPPVSRLNRSRKRQLGLALSVLLLLGVGGASWWYYRDANGVSSVETPSTSESPESTVVTPPDKSIAVLPFVNMSPDKAQDYFSDGLSEELLNLLTKVPQLQVAARTSSFYYKGKQTKLPEMARELHVAYLLEGSVRKSGNRVRITAQLIRAADGYHQWSETYDRTLEDIFAVQEEIAAAVVTQLQVTLLGRSPAVETTNPKAYALTLQARHLGRQFTRESLEQSIALYQQALAIDPNYAVAWVGVARSYSIEADIDLRPVDEAFRLAREATYKALATAPDFALAHAGLGLIAMKYDGDLSAAARHFEKALALEPANLDIIGDAGELAWRLGRLDQAVALDEYVVARDPVNPDGHDRLGLAYVRIGRLDDAIASWRAALRLNPGRIAVQMHIGWALLLKGDGKAALVAMQQESVEFTRLLGLVMAHHTLGNRAASDTALNELIGRYGKGGEFNIAYVLAWRGETDRAFEWLTKAAAYRVPLYIWADRLGFANIQDDPRWLPFLRKYGMAPEQLAAIKFEVKLPQ